MIMVILAAVINCIILYQSQRQLYFLQLHVPFALKKDATFSELRDGDVIGYDPAIISATWEVCTIIIISIIGHYKKYL